METISRRVGNEVIKMRLLASPCLSVCLCLVTCNNTRTAERTYGQIPILVNIGHKQHFLCMKACISARISSVTRAYLIITKIEPSQKQFIFPIRNRPIWTSLHVSMVNSDHPQVRQYAHLGMVTFDRIIKRISYICYWKKINCLCDGSTSVNIKLHINRRQQYKIAKYLSEQNTFWTVHFFRKCSVFRDN
jgi:hypothetical protein